MAVLIRRTGIAVYPEEAVLISSDELQAGLKRGEYEHVEADIYRQVAQYQTKVMEPAPVAAAPEPVEEAVGDDELRVACPSCGAAPGEPCVTESGAKARYTHRPRIEEAGGE